MKALRLLAVALALAGASPLADESARALTLGQRKATLASASWAFPGASVDMDFANGRYYGLTPSALTTSRASTETEICNGQLYTFAANQPAITPCGLWVWEARTNGIRNSTGAGGSAGVPPTNWTKSSGSGVAINPGAPFIANGITWVPFDIVGTTTATTQLNVAFEAATQIAATYGQTWSESAYVYGAGVLPTVILDMAERNNVGGLISGHGTSFFPPVPTPSYAVVNATIGSPAAAFLLPRLFLNVVNTATYSGTIYIGLTQVELNPNIPATVASAVKAADGAGGVISASGVYTVTGGTCTTQPTLNVTWDAGGLMTVNSVAVAGSCSVLPPSPATLAYASGAATGWTGASVTLTPTDNSATGGATGPILTSAAAVTRASSVVTAPVTVGASYAMACAAQPTIPIPGANSQYCAQMDDGTASNRLTLRRNNTLAFNPFAVLAGVTKFSYSSGTWAQNATGKLAASINSSAPAEFAYANGSSIGTTTQPVPAALSRLLIGSGGAGGVTFFNGALSRISIWQTAISPSVAQQATR